MHFIEKGQMNPRLVDPVRKWYKAKVLYLADSS